MNSLFSTISSHTLNGHNWVMAGTPRGNRVISVWIWISTSIDSSAFHYCSSLCCSKILEAFAWKHSCCCRIVPWRRYSGLSNINMKRWASHTEHVNQLVCRSNWLKDEQVKRATCECDFGVQTKNIIASFISLKKEQQHPGLSFIHTYIIIIFIYLGMLIMINSQLSCD